MKIFVCVKQVPDTSGKVAVDENGILIRSSMPTIINPDDMNAMEAALQLKDETGCKVVAVTIRRRRSGRNSLRADRHRRKTGQAGREDFAKSCLSGCSAQECREVRVACGDLKRPLAF